LPLRTNILDVFVDVPLHRNYKFLQIKTKALHVI